MRRQAGDQRGDAVTARIASPLDTDYFWYLTQFEPELPDAIEMGRSRRVAGERPAVENQGPRQRIAALNKGEGEGLEGLGCLPDGHPGSGQAADGQLAARWMRPHGRTRDGAGRG